MVSVDSQGQLKKADNLSKIDQTEACRLDNKLRLKNVRNLEDLIKFKVATVEKPENMIKERTKSTLDMNKSSILDSSIVTQTQKTKNDNQN